MNSSVTSLIAFFVSVCTMCIAVHSQYTDEIVLPQGKLIGMRSSSGDYKKYLGIPYGTLTERFQDVGKPPNWNDTLLAIDDSVICNQYSDGPVGQEDCLVLNVFTPGANNNNYPVMVFIHGGGFYHGNSKQRSFNPIFLVQKGVIVVTINYRVGAFGFLCLKHEKAPGNIGLKDQIAALNWVKENIRYFGGNSDCVTIFGNSNGAASVNYLVITPHARGLFHRAIMQSGSILMPMAYNSNSSEMAYDVASRLGYDSTETEDLLNVFLEKSADEIVEATYRNTTNDVYAPYVFSACVEDPLISEAPILIKPLRETLSSIDLDPGFQLMIGYNDKEGISYVSRYNNFDVLNEDFGQALPNYLGFSNDTEKNNFIEDLKFYYFGNETVTYDRLIDYFTDSIFAYTATTLSEILLSKSDISLYNYYFKYSSLRNFPKLNTPYANLTGAAHGDELYYLFDSELYQTPLIESDMKMIDTMTTIWTDFAKTGSPTPGGSSLEWNASEQNNLKFLKIDESRQMTGVPEEDRIEFWRNVYRKYGVDN